MLDVQNAITNMWTVHQIVTMSNGYLQLTLKSFNSLDTLSSLNDDRSGWLTSLIWLEKRYWGIHGKPKIAALLLPYTIVSWHLWQQPSGSPWPKGILTGSLLLHLQWQGRVNRHQLRRAIDTEEKCQTGWCCHRKILPMWRVDEALSGLCSELGCHVIIERGML